MKIEIKKGQRLTKEEIGLMYSNNLKEYGHNQLDVKEEQDSIFFFVIDDKKIASYGMTKPIKILHENKKYNTFFIGNILSVKKNRGYGGFLMKHLLSYLKGKRKSGIGFCKHSTSIFYRKQGFNIAEDLARKFQYKTTKGYEQLKEDDDALYIGNNRLIKEVVKSNQKADLLFS